MRRFVKRFSGTVAVVAMIAIIATASVMGSTDAHAADQRPFKGHAHGVFTGPNSGSGTVIATHVGKGDVVFTDLNLDFGGGTPDGDNVCFPVIGGYQKFTAANGDEIEMNYDSGRFCVDPSTGAPVYGNFVTTVTNGTGRFDEAVGSILIDAYATEEGWASDFVGDSWIHF